MSHAVNVSSYSSFFSSEKEKIMPKVVYVRDGYGTPQATIAMDQEGNFGVTICNYKVGDQFVKTTGRNKAIGRLLSSDKKNWIPRVNKTIPFRVVKSEIDGVLVELVYETQLSELIQSTLLEMQRKTQPVMA